MSTSPRILVLEDSILVAMELEAALTDKGFSAIVAGSLAAAHARLDETCEGTGIAAALLDLMLPDGTSFDLAQRLHNQGTAVAILSGADDDALPADFPAVKHFRKPVDTDRVIRWIAERIDSPPAGGSAGTCAAPALRPEIREP